MQKPPAMITIYLPLPLSSVFAEPCPADIDQLCTGGIS